MTSNGPDLIVWKESYFIGFPRFDREHVELMEMANSIILAFHRKAPQSEVDSAFSALLERTCKHFDDEEAIMADTFYSHLQQHRSNHNELVRVLVGFAGEIKRGTARPERAGEFLMAGLLEHVLQADVYYAKYFTERGIS